MNKIEYELLFKAFCYIYGQCIHSDNHNNKQCLEDDMFHDHCKLLVDMVTNKMNIVHPVTMASLQVHSCNISLINKMVTSHFFHSSVTHMHCQVSCLLCSHSIPVLYKSSGLDYINCHGNTPSTFHLGSNWSQLLCDNINITG